MSFPCKTRGSVMMQGGLSLYRANRNLKVKVLDFVKSGGRYWIRTSDLLHVKQVL